MSVIFLLIFISLSVALCFLGAFIWAVKNGQYEDDYSPGVRMLFDDHPATPQRSGKRVAERQKEVNKQIMNNK